MIEIEMPPNMNDLFGPLARPFKLSKSLLERSMRWTSTASSFRQRESEPCEAQEAS